MADPRPEGTSLQEFLDCGSNPVAAGRPSLRAEIWHFRTWELPQVNRGTDRADRHFWHIFIWYNRDICKILVYIISECEGQDLSCFALAVCQISGGGF